jgi:hypothetical protein
MSKHGIAAWAGFTVAFASCLAFGGFPYDDVTRLDVPLESDDAPDTQLTEWIDLACLSKVSGSFFAETCSIAEPVRPLTANSTHEVPAQEPSVARHQHPSDGLEAGMVGPIETFAPNGLEVILWNGSRIDLPSPYVADGGAADPIRLSAPRPAGLWR